MDKLTCIITGLENSGTTYLSRIIFSHSMIMSGFETGVLTGELKNFKTLGYHPTHIMKDVEQWGLPRGSVDKIIKMKDYDEVYKYIFDNKGSYPGEYQQLIRESQYIVDKTPRYVENISDLHKKINCRIPIFIIAKKADNVSQSQISRRYPAFGVQDRLINVIEQFKYILDNNLKSIYVLNYERFMDDKEKYLKIIEDIFYRYNPHLPRESLSEEKYREKIKNVKSNFMYKKWTPRRKIVNIELVSKEVREEYDRLLEELCIK